MTTTTSQPLTPWGLTRLAAYGSPAAIDGEPVAVDPTTQMAVWQTSDGAFTHTARHRQTYTHKATTTSRRSDGKGPGDVINDNDTESSVD